MAKKNDEQLTLEITIDEANIILDALGNMPFKQVYTLIGKIQEQAGAQLSDEAISAGQQDEAN